MSEERNLITNPEYAGAIVGGLQSPACEKPQSLLERLEEREKWLGKELIAVQETIVLLKNNPELEGFAKKVRSVILF